MLDKIAQIVADPNRTVIGTGDQAMVVTRRTVNARTGQEITAAERAAGQINPAQAASALQSGAVDPNLNRLSRVDPAGPLRKAGANDLSDAEQDVLRELKDRDRDVRQHEQKHMAAAGELARGGPRYHYQVGPDGKPYAVGGEVQIDTSPVPGDPEATRRKAERIRQAALAPGDPSGPDLAVAQGARQLASGQSNATTNSETESASPASAAYQQNQPDDSAPDYELRLFA